MESYQNPDEEDFETAWRELAIYKRDMLIRMLDFDIDLTIRGINTASLPPGLEHEFTLARWTDRDIPKEIPGYTDQDLNHRLKLTKETRLFLQDKKPTTDV